MLDDPAVPAGAASPPAAPAPPTKLLVISTAKNGDVLTAISLKRSQWMKISGQGG
ncbi:hypothetical protein [Kushneria aurantia]|uniref:Uncharacterized protein n=1 Tax=Kushneria aurantia TaxID=504092 RepID=A0ABV6G5Q3_9GAMM|nr:hypothetical protein [Kushneria aurantia]